MTDWITVREAANIAGFHEEHIRRLTREGKIKGYKFSIVWQIEKQSLLEYLEKMKEKGRKRGPRKS